MVSNEKKDTGKDLLVGGAAILATVTSAPALIAAAAGTLVAVGWNHVAAGAQRRAERLMKGMIEGDDEPASFAERVQQRLESDDEETLSAFRALLTNAVQAISPDALPPMAYVGRCYFRGSCPLQLARGALELFNNVTATDLTHLRKLMGELAAVKGNDVTVVADMPAKKDGGKRGWRAWPDGSPGDERTLDITPIENATQLFGALKRAGLGTESGAFGIGGSPKAIELEPHVILLLRDALNAAV